MAQLQLNVPGIAIPNVRFANIVGRIAVDDTEMAFAVTTELVGHLPYLTVGCRITNGLVVGVRAKVAPTSADDAVEEVAYTTADIAGVATAFTDAYAAFRVAGPTGGKVGLMNYLRTLGVMLPGLAGAVT